MHHSLNLNLATLNQRITLAGLPRVVDFDPLFFLFCSQLVEVFGVFEDAFLSVLGHHIIHKYRWFSALTLQIKLLTISVMVAPKLNFLLRMLIFDPLLQIFKALVAKISVSLIFWDFEKLGYEDDHSISACELEISIVGYFREKVVESDVVVDGCWVGCCLELLLLVEIDNLAVDASSSQTLLYDLMVYLASDQQTHMRVLCIRIFFYLFLGFELVDWKAKIWFSAFSRMETRDPGSQEFSYLLLLLAEILGYVVLFELISHIFMYFPALHSFYG